MANTTNFGWETPDDTDLVKDGAAAMRTLGNSIDTSFVDLKGGTTNQVLAKNSNTDLDFKWVADATGIPATIFDAKGDLIAASAADTAARLAVGANGTVLIADSAETTGLRWGPVPGLPNLAQIATGTLSGTSVTISSLSTYNNLYLRIPNGGSTSGNSNQKLRVRINNNSGSNYLTNGWAQEIADGSRTSLFSSQTAILVQNDNMFSTGLGALWVSLNNCKEAGFTTGSAFRYYTATSQADGQAAIDFIYTQSEAVSSLVITLDGSATFGGGTYTLWGN